MKAKTWVAMGLTWGSRALVTGMSLETISGTRRTPSIPVPGQWIHLRRGAARKNSREGQPQKTSASGAAASSSASVSHQTKSTPGKVSSRSLITTSSGSPGPTPPNMGVTMTFIRQFPF